MSNTQRIAKRRATRIKRRAQERQDLFTNDYVRHKYPTIHDEATRVFQLLNNQYPNKSDLRKTPEHNAWKIQGTANPHPAFSIKQVFYILPNPQFSAIYQPPTNSEQPTNPEPSTNSEQPTNPEPQSNPKPPTNSEQPTNPEPQSNPELPSSPELSTTFNPPPSPELPSSPEPPISPDPPSSPEQSSNPEPSTTSQPQKLNTPSSKLPSCDNMQLIIPLIKPPAKKPNVTTETLQVITEEVLQEGNTLQPFGEIDPEMFEKIINELRADPDLQNIFSDVEKQVEFEELGMDLDIPEDCNMLETELENWEFW